MNKLMTFAALAAGVVTPGAMVSATTLTLDTVTLVGSDYEFSYSGTLSGDEGLVPGSKLVILDFGDYVAGSISSGIYAADLVATTEFLTLGLPFASGEVDDPLITNLVFTWIGLPFNSIGGPFADVSFSGLSAKSTNSAVTLGSYSALTTNNNGFATGTPVNTVGFVAVAAQTAVPEPASWGLLVLGLGAVGMGLRRRRVALQFS